MKRHTLHKLRNLLHSAVLVLGIAAIVGACVWVLWGGEALVWALVGVAIALLLSPSIPPGLILSLYRATPISPDGFREGYALLENISRRARLPITPELYHVPTTLMNSFTVGNRHASAITLTDGMLRNFTPRELAGVLAHEVCHIANNDLWTMKLADTMSRMAAFLSYFGVILLFLNLPLLLTGVVTVPWPVVLLLIFTPTLVSLMQLALSRTREYEADADAVHLLGDATGLISALIKMEDQQTHFWERILVPGARIPDPSLLRTHPPTRERVRRLMDLQATASDEGITTPAEEVFGLPETFGHVRTPPRRRWHGLWY